jgi:hypothetical protein
MTRRDRELLRALNGVVRMARRFVPDPRVVQWEEREIALKQAFDRLDLLIIYEEDL